jgi:hypothetical protein
MFCVAWIINCASKSLYKGFIFNKKICTAVSRKEPSFRNMLEILSIYNLPGTMYEIGTFNNEIFAPAVAESLADKESFFDLRPNAVLKLYL